METSTECSDVPGAIVKCSRGDVYSSKDFAIIGQRAVNVGNSPQGTFIGKGFRCTLYIK